MFSLFFSLLFSLISSSLSFAGTNFLVLSFFIVFSLILPLFFSFFLYNLCLTFMGMQRFLFCCCFFLYFLWYCLGFSFVFPIFCLSLPIFCPSFSNFFLNIFFSKFVTVFSVQHPILSLVLPLFFSSFFSIFSLVFPCFALLLLLFFSQYLLHSQSFSVL